MRKYEDEELAMVVLTGIIKGLEADGHGPMTDREMVLCGSMVGGLIALIRRADELKETGE